MTLPIKELRIRLLLNQKEMAQLLNVCRQMVWNYENGRSKPSYEVIKKLLVISKEHNWDFKAEDFL
jgi:DNA-binding XRE family transcriptional regulator